MKTLRSQLYQRGPQSSQQRNFISPDQSRPVFASHGLADDLLNQSRELCGTTPGHLVNLNDGTTPTEIHSPKRASRQRDMFPGLNASESYKRLMEQPNAGYSRADPSPVRHPSVGRTNFGGRLPSSYSFADCASTYPDYVQRADNVPSQRTPLVKCRGAND